MAADPLGTLSYIGVKGALVIYNADDPSLFSSQNEQDNRNYCRLFGLPLFEPSSAQEMKDMTVAAFRLSHELGMPVMVRSTTRVAHLRGVVELGEITEPPKPVHVEKDHSKVTLPVNATRMHRELLERLDRARVISNASPFNFARGAENAPFGIVASSIGYAYAMDAVTSLGLSGKTAVFRAGLSYPEPDEALLAFLRGKQKVLVIEELEPLMENFLRALAQKYGVEVEIGGKGVAGLSRLYEYDSEIVREAAAVFFGVPWKPALRPDLADRPRLPVRPPNLCPGCRIALPTMRPKRRPPVRTCCFPTISAAILSASARPCAWPTPSCAWAHPRPCPADWIRPRNIPGRRSCHLSETAPFSIPA